MDLANELFGTFSGQLVLAIGFVMIVVMPLTIWWGINHTRRSPCEEQDRKVHPDQGKAP